MQAIHFTDEDRIFLSSRLRAARQKAGLTQEELGNLLGKGQSYVAKYETRERDLEFFEVLALCHALDTKLEELVSTDLHRLLTGEGGAV